MTGSTCFKINDAITNDPDVISNAFNSYFQSVFTLDNHAVPEFRYVAQNNKLENIAISCDGVLNLILKLDTKKCTGSDGIPNSFLSRYSLWTAKYLTLIFQKSLDSGVVPRSWKSAKVLPLHKSGDKQLLSNYRPISLTPYSCKMLEHIIHKHIIEFLDSNNILSSAQHGFRRGYSTVTQLVDFMHDVAYNLDLGNQIDAIFIDFSKAFDSVIHSKLLLKLNLILDNPRIVSWIASFLHSRSQFVSFSSTDSSPIDVTSGVPQGSVLGPLLFLLFINDLPHSISSKIRLYADDCVLYETINSIDDHYHLAQSLTSFSNWCDTWQMNVNCTKTVVMSFTNRRNPFSFDYFLGGTQLNRVSQYKYLGVILTEHLSWTSHIDHVCRKALKKLGYLRRTLPNAPRDTKLLLYKSLIRPVLEYASVVWFPYKHCEISLLDNIQRKSIRFIFHNYSRNFSPTTALQSLNIPSQLSRYQNEALKFLYGIINSSSGLGHGNLITFTDDSCTRSSHALNVTPFFARTNTFKYSFFPRAIELWNSLPGSIRSLPLTDFIVAVDEYLTDA